jgi:hypothetical protein
MNKTLEYSIISIAIAGIIGLSGCGGGGGSSSETGSVTTSGVITGFGSVYVNGVEYETDGSSFSLDDGDDGIESEDELEVGMVVTLTGTLNADGVTGTATHIEYDDELEGIVSANNVNNGIGTLVIMGQTVNVDADTEFKNDADILDSSGALTDSIEMIEAGNIIEVSGYPDGMGYIYATYVELKDDAHSPGEEIEVKGIVEDDNDTDMLFMLGDLSVDYSNAALPDGTPDAGDYVEVKSTAGFTGEVLIASEVELEDDLDDIDGHEGDEVELSGTVTAVEPDILIGMQLIIINDATYFEHGSRADIVTGVDLEVEGHLDTDGALIAEEVEFNIDGDHEIEGLVEAVTGTGADGSVTVSGLELLVNADTVMLDEQDDYGAPERYFGLDDLRAGDYVEIKYYADNTTGNLVATKVEREDQTED